MRIDVQNLSISYGSRKVLRDICVTVDQVGTITILGSSGAGKSTFLRVLSGLAKRSSLQMTGEVKLDGLPPAELLTAGEIGFMFQEPNLLPQLTVDENIRLPLELRKADTSYAEHLLEMVGLADHRKRLPRELSGGMKTRVALARTLAPKPRLLLLDEPFSALDVGWRFELYRELQCLQFASPVVTVLVTHDIQEALLLSNRILVLSRNGQVARDLAIQSSLPPGSFDDPIGGRGNEFRELHDFFINEKSDFGI